MQTKTKTIILIVIILIATAGFGIYIFQKNKKVTSAQPTQNIEQSTVKEDTVDEGQQPEPENIPSVPPTEVRRVLGTVEQISGQEITLKDFRKISSVVSTISDQSARMIVGVDQSTLIERLTYKDKAVLNAELSAFLKNIQKIQTQNPSTPPIPPEPFTLEKVAIGDIKVGDKIMASFAEDISKLTTFTATRIEIQN